MSQLQAATIHEFWKQNHNSPEAALLLRTGAETANLFTPKRIHVSDHASLVAIGFALLTIINREPTASDKALTAVTHALIGAYGIGRQRGKGKVDEATQEALPFNHRLKQSEERDEQNPAGTG